MQNSHKFLNDDILDIISSTDTPSAAKFLELYRNLSDNGENLLKEEGEFYYNLSVSDLYFLAKKMGYYFGREVNEAVLILIEDKFGKDPGVYTGKLESASGVVYRTTDERGWTSLQVGVLVKQVSDLNLQVTVNGTIQFNISADDIVHHFKPNKYTIEIYQRYESLEKHINELT